MRYVTIDEAIQIFRQGAKTVWLILRDGKQLRVYTENEITEHYRFAVSKYEV